MVTRRIDKQRGAPVIDVHGDDKTTEGASEASVTAASWREPDVQAGLAAQRLVSGGNNKLSALATPGVVTTSPAQKSGALRPTELLRNLEHGTLRLAVPLLAGKKLGPLDIRPDTRMVVELKVENGRIDREHTKVVFRHGDGTETSLDGPLWLDPRSLYIDKKSRLRVELPAFPDLNVTKTVLGKNERRMPSTMAELADLLARASATPSNQELDGLVDLSAADLEFEGSLRPGEVRLGDGSQVELAAGNHIRAFDHGTGLRVEVQGAVESLTLSANGSQMTTGAGNLSLSVDFAPGEPTTVAVSQLDVRDIALSTPAGQGENTLSMARLTLAGDTNNPVLRYLEKKGDNPASLTLDLPALELEGVTANLATRGVDGQPTTVTLGGDEGVRMKARVRIDSSTGAFDVAGEVHALDLRLGSFALVDSPAFDLKLASGQIRGAAQFSATGDRSGPADVNVVALAGAPLIVSADIADAHLGKKSDAAVLVDVAADTGGQLELRSFSLTRGGHPTFAGSAKLLVKLDSVRLPLAGQTIELGQGAVGRLILDDMAWQADDAFPSVKARLDVELPASTQLDGNLLRGVAGARLYVNTAGATVLSLAATLSRDGTLVCDSGISVRGLEVRGGYESNMPALGDVSLPADKLAHKGPLRLTPMRKPEAPVSAAAGKVKSSQASPLPALDISPALVFSAVRDMSLDLTIPTEPFSLQVAKLVSRSETDIGLTTIESGYDLSMHGSLPNAGSLRAELAVRDFTLSPEGSRITCDPPLDLRIVGGVFVGAARVTTDIDVSVTGLSIHKDPETGVGRLEPDIVLTGVLPAVARQAGLEGDIKRSIGETLSMTLFGTPTFPLASGAFVTQLAKALPELGGTTSASTQTSQEDGVELAVDVAGLQRHIRLDKTAVKVAKASFGKGTIDLGHGQKITFGEGTRLELLGSASDFTLEGEAVLGATRLGNEQAMAELGKGSARVKLHVKARPDGEYDVTLEMSEVNAEGMGVSTRSAEGTTALKNVSVHGATLRLSSDGKGTSFTVKLPEAVATLEQKAPPQGTVAGDFDAILGTVKGSLEFDGKRWLGELRDIDIALGSGAGRARKGHLRLQGSGRFAVDANGHVTVTQSGRAAALRLNGDIASADGSRMKFSNGSFSKLEIEPTTGAWGVQDLVAEVSAVVRTSSEDGSVAPMVDIRSGRLQGALKVDATGIKTVGRVVLKNVDASVTNLEVPANKDARIELKQIDLRGDGSFSAGADGIRFESAKRTDGNLNRTALRATAVASDIQVRVQKSGVHVDLEEGATLEFDIEQLVVSDAGLSMSLKNGHFEGALEGGSVSLGDNGVALPLGNDAVVSTDFAYLRTGELAGGADKIEIDATIRVEGTLTADADAATADALKNKLQIEKANGKATMRFIGRLVARGSGDFATSGHLSVDGQARIRLRGPLKVLPE